METGTSNAHGASGNIQKPVIAMMAGPPAAQKVPDAGLLSKSSLVQSIMTDNKATTEKLDKVAEAVSSLTAMYKEQFRQDGNIYLLK